MKGKSQFTKAEAEAIIVLIKQKLKADAIKQKSIRNQIRALGFYASDFGLGGGYNENDFLRVVTVIGGNNITAVNREVILKADKKEPLNVLKTENKVLGLAPIADENSRILILGTMPGVESLKKQAYYGNTRNLLWQLMAEVTGKKVPEGYAEKKQFLLKNKIALWDICQACFREGSLDSNISEETPNDIKSFMENHPQIKVIAFNGKESAKLFGKHVGSLNGINLLALPSTSLANAGVAWDTKINEWSKLKAYL